MLPGGNAIRVRSLAFPGMNHVIQYHSMKLENLFSQQCHLSYLLPKIHLRMTQLDIKVIHRLIYNLYSLTYTLNIILVILFQ